MPIKLGNNARAVLAAPLTDDGTTIVLNTEQAATFPGLSAGEWFPMTLCDPDGHIEVVKVTARNSNLFTAQRGMEGTTPRAWEAGDRAEIRLTAGTIDQVRIEGQEYASAAATSAKTAANTYTDTTAGTLRGEMAANKSAADATASAIRGELNAAIASERSTSAGEIAALTGTVNTKFPTAGGTITGGVTVTGDITTYRPGSPSTGVIFFGNTGGKYLHFDGSNYIMPGGHLYVNGSPVWTSGNFNPGSYMPTTGGTFTGNLTIQNGAGYITFYDVDWGHRHIHCNDGNIGFLTSGGGWACYSSNDGSFVATGNIGAYSDRRHKKHIRTIKSALSIVEQLRGVRYVRKKDGKACVGVIAQEVQAVLPEVVGEGQDGLHVDYGNLGAVAIEAIKELAARVRKLEGG